MLRNMNVCLYIMRWPLASWRRQEPPLPNRGSASCFAESAAARRLDDEHVAFLHLDLEGRTEVLARAADALHPVAADVARRTACHAERRHAAVVGEHGSGHGFEKAHAPLAAVAATISARAAAAATHSEFFQAHGKTPLENLGIGEPRVGHVRLHHAGAIEIRPRARATGDRLVILVGFVAEGEVVHGALRGGERAEGAV